MAGAPADDSRLETLAELATACGAPHLATEVALLAARVRDGLFYVACVGQFKRGKSSLLNALVGKSVLPVGVVPVTAVVTVLRYGEQESARVRFASGDWRAIPVGDLALYVTEEQNPANRRGAAAVEVFVPHPLLASGMCLVDTPGIGSVFLANTEVTRAFVPHVDAALVVLGADPPISAEELALVADIGRQCPDLVFVLNKADKLGDAERQEAGDFTRRVLAGRLGRDGAAVFEVSATERLAGAGLPRDWPGLAEALSALARHSGSELVRAAEDRGFALLADRLQHQLDEQSGALLRPIEESERRIEALRACVADAERALNDLGYLLSAEQERLGRVFAAKREAFIERATPGARAELAAALPTIDVHRRPRLRAKAVELAQTIAGRWLDRWVAEAQPAAEALYVEASRRFVDLANAFLERVAGSGGAALSGLPREVSPETGFRVRSRLYYTSLMTYTSQTPVGWFLDLLRSRERQLRALERQVGAYLEMLIFTNAHRIEGDLAERVLESRRRLQFELRTALAEAATTAERALAHARERHAQGSQAVQADVERITRLGARLRALAGRKETAP